MSRSEHAWTVDEIARELDMVVFALEQAGRGTPVPDDERAKLRRKLERLRDRLQDLFDAMR